MLRELGDPGKPGPFTRSQIWRSYEQSEAYTNEAHPWKLLIYSKKLQEDMEADFVILC